MRIHSGEKRNQSVISPFSIQRSMILLLVSKLSNSTAISRPAVLTSLINRFLSRALNNCDFAATSSILFSSSNACDAGESGCTANRVAAEGGYMPKDRIVCKCVHQLMGSNKGAKRHTSTQRFPKQ